jgi:tetratricopeptide (TPR) repeat protein
MQLLDDTNPRWFRAAHEVTVTLGKFGELDRSASLALDVARRRASGAARVPQLMCVLAAVRMTLATDRSDLVEKLHEPIEALVRDAATDEPMMVATMATARALLAERAGDLFAAWELAALAASRLEDAGALRNACAMLINCAVSAIELGDYVYAERVLRKALSQAERMGTPTLVASACENLGLALAGLGAYTEARAVEQRGIDAHRAADQGRGALLCCSYLAMILVCGGEFTAAVAAAGEVIAAPACEAARAAYALTVRARARLGLGERAAALADATRAMEILTGLGSIYEGEAALRLTYAEVLDATGEHDAARAALKRAHAQLEKRAARISVPERRTLFLERVPEHARTRALMREWGVAD